MSSQKNTNVRQQLHSFVEITQIRTAPDLPFLTIGNVSSKGPPKMHIFVDPELISQICLPAQGNLEAPEFRAFTTILVE